MNIIRARELTRVGGKYRRKGLWWYILKGKDSEHDLIFDGQIASGNSMDLPHFLADDWQPDELYFKPEDDCLAAQAKTVDKRLDSNLEGIVNLEDLYDRVGNLEKVYPQEPTCPVCHEPVTKEGCKCWKKALGWIQDARGLMHEVYGQDTHGKFDDKIKKLLRRESA